MNYLHDTLPMDEVEDRRQGRQRPRDVVILLGKSALSVSPDSAFSLGLVRARDEQAVRSAAVAVELLQTSSLPFPEQQLPFLGDPQHHDGFVLTMSQKDSSRLFPDIARLVVFHLRPFVGLFSAPYPSDGQTESEHRVQPRYWN